MLAAASAHRRGRANVRRNSRLVAFREPFLECALVPESGAVDRGPGWIPTRDDVPEHVPHRRKVEFGDERVFGMRLKLLRLAMGLTRQEIADLCGFDDGSWGNWENGSRRPQAMNEVVRRIAKATGCSAGWLMWGEEIP